MRLQQGDIVLIPVPFTDLSSHKRRPVVIVSADAYNDTGPDFIVVAMTSNPAQTPVGFADYGERPTGGAAQPAGHDSSRQDLHACPVACRHPFRNGVRGHTGPYPRDARPGRRVVRMRSSRQTAKKGSVPRPGLEPGTL